MLFLAEILLTSINEHQTITNHNTIIGIVACTFTFMGQLLSKQLYRNMQIFVFHAPYAILIFNN